MVKKEEFTESQREAIDTYGDRVSTMTDTVEIIRKRPGMYGGGIGDLGFLTLIREIFQNNIDQILDPASPANWAYLSYDMRTLEVVGSDNGLGFPYADMVRMVTKLHTSKNFTKTRKGEYSSGLHGAGLKVVNALSKYCRVESYKYDGTAKAVDFDKGYLVKGPYNIKNKDKFQGSRVIFAPDLDIMGPLALDWKVVYRLIKQILSLTPLGSIVDFKAIDLDGVEHNEHIVNTDGIITEFISTVQFPMGKPIIFSEDNGEQKLDIAFMYDTGGQDGPDSMEKVTAFCNMCPTIAGYHITGAMDGITKWFTSYMNNIYLANQKGKLKVTAADIKCGLNVMISAACLEPMFIGQAKEQLANQEMRKFCSDVVSRGLEAWAKANPQQLGKMCDYFKGLADIRMKAENSKAKMTAKMSVNVLNGMPDKYIPPTEINDELVIVEGDSAKAPASVERDPKRQGIMPIRGKIASAYSKSKAEFWNNVEVVGISHIILGGKNYWKNFDPYKDVEWNKIIFMADADVDGAHISSLLLRFFVRYMPQLIEAGKVYKATPPLYSYTKDKKHYTYYADATDFIRLVQKTFVKINNLTYLDGKELNGKELTVLFSINEEYVYWLENMAFNYACDPYLLEFALYNAINSLSIQKISKDLKEKFRFMHVSRENGNIIYDGTIEESNFIPMNDKLFNDCSYLIGIMKKNIQFYYKLNGQPVSIYQIMKAFESSKPKGIKRYKGLGEMKEGRLGESTLRPDSDRTLIRYTLKDVKEEIEAIRDLESDRSKLMQFVGTVKRTDLLE